MSTTKFSFKARVRVGDQIIPLSSEIVAGTSDGSDGVKNGFLFQLDRQLEDPPVLIPLGEMIAFIENKLGAGAGSLGKNSNLALLEKAFPEYIGGDSPFSSGNGTQIQIQSFQINSTAEEFLFSINVDLMDADPTKGLIALPAELASWITINNLAISFQATSKKT